MTDEQPFFAEWENFKLLLLHQLIPLLQFEADFAGLGVLPLIFS